MKNSKNSTLNSPSELITTNEIRDSNIPRIDPHAFPHNSTITELYMRKQPYQFQTPTLDYTKDQLYSRATKPTNSYDFWF